MCVAEIEGYVAVLEAFFAQGEITWRKDLVRRADATHVNRDHMFMID